jgi:predicted amidophosphoribosyltransferase
MLCGKCQDDNLPDAAFCGECGAKLEGCAHPAGLATTWLEVLPQLWLKALDNRNECSRHGRT